MEAVTAHAFVIVGGRQRESVRDERVGAMEGGVEAGHLRKRRESLDRRLDPGDMMRLVQRRKRNEPLELRQHRTVDQNRRGEIRSPVHDAMANGDHLAVVPTLAQPVEDRVHRRAVIDGSELWIEGDLGLLARRRLDQTMRATHSRAEIFDLPGRQRTQGAVDTRSERSELNGR